MLSHVVVGSNDIERSKRFYDAVPGVRGAGACGWHEPEPRRTAERKMLALLQGRRGGMTRTPTVTQERILLQDKHLATDTLPDPALGKAPEAGHTPMMQQYLPL
jgi:catechol 2,3-dioxygenase-like lactoylglutathione lyase family enzyme